ncbi:MAG TPA: hypothetical protein VHC69_17450 [Polyangiaceae bacterium]|nr:hypothetical protein [Polyangiaceae bacterium]
MSAFHEYVIFGDASVYPPLVSAEVGDLVPFEVRPAVPAGSQWSLECRGRVRFTDQPTSTGLDWTANPRAVRLETIVSPWDPLPPSEHPSRAWLSYSLRDEGEASILDRELPFRRVAFKEIGPVTYSFSYAVGGDAPSLTVADRGERIVATYRTPADKGVPLAPRIDAMLLESGNRTILYAEVRTEFGTIPKELVGYDVTLSYAKARVTGPVEIIVVGWIGHDQYWKPFTVTRYPEKAPTTRSAPSSPPLGP